MVNQADGRNSAGLACTPTREGAGDEASGCVRAQRRSLPPDDEFEIGWLSRQRVIFPEGAGIGAAPHRYARAAGSPSRAQPAAAGEAGGETA
jgi:hypothetical protein